MPEIEYLTIDHLTTKEITRIFSKIVVTPRGCWEWQGKRNKHGYGEVKLRRKSISVHRVLYAWAVEPLPRRRKGEKTPQLDHVTCNNKPCCNPAHPSLVTPRENSLRTNNMAAINARKTHCVRGHLLPENRICLACDRQRYADMTPEQRQRRKEQLARNHRDNRYGANRDAFLERCGKNLRDWKTRQALTQKASTDL